MVAVPALTPFTTPAVVTVAIAVLAELQTPPVVASVNVVFAEVHAVNTPPMLAGAPGTAFIVTVLVALVLPQVFVMV